VQLTDRVRISCPQSIIPQCAFASSNALPRWQYVRWPCLYPYGKSALKQYIARVVLICGNAQSYKALGQAMADVGFLSFVSGGERYPLPSGMYFCNGSLTEAGNGQCTQGDPQCSLRIGAARRTINHYTASLIVMPARDIGWCGLTPRKPSP